MPFQVVLSYRRGDAAGNARGVYEALADRFGEDNVFMDVDAIEPGVDFVDAIRQAVGSCDVFLALIGQQWLTAADRSGQRRLDDPNDYVRLEIETALGRGIRVIPVLVQDVDMPTPEQLPPSLAPLARRNAIDIRDTSWRYDVERLIETLEKLKRQLPSEPGEPGDERPSDEPRAGLRVDRRLATAAGIAAVLVAAALGALVLLRNGERETAEQLVFAADGRIFAIGTDGSAEVDLTQRRAGDRDPDWSPDGNRLALARAGDIWVVDASGEETRAITSGGEEDGAPAWSPDGTRIAFDRGKTGAGDGTHDVWVMNVDGTQQANLTAGPTESGAAPDLVAERRADRVSAARRAVVDALRWRRQATLTARSAGNEASAGLVTGRRTKSRSRCSPAGTRPTSTSTALAAPTSRT